jgi:hypothetical protein
MALSVLGNTGFCQLDTRDFAQPVDGCAAELALKCFDSLKLSSTLLGREFELLVVGFDGFGTFERIAKPVRAFISSFSLVMGLIQISVSSARVLIPDIGFFEGVPGLC